MDPIFILSMYTLEASPCWAKSASRKAGKAKPWHYEKFLDLWKDADSGMPEVADARKRPATLNDA